MAPDDGADGADRSDESFTVIEPRWPVALAVFTFLVITVVLRVTVPRRESIGAHWVVPSIEAALLVVLLVAHPRDRSGRAAVWLRRLSITLILALVVAALVSTTVRVVSPPDRCLHRRPTFSDENA